MHFLELEQYKVKYPSLSPFISSLDDYLSELVDAPTARDIVPILAAKRLSIDEGLALTLLMLAHEAGLIEPQYLVYCTDTETVIGAYPSLKDVPGTVFCPFHDKEHDVQGYYIELTFQFTAKASGRYVQQVR